MCHSSTIGRREFHCNAQEFVDPDYVLKDHVTLYNVTKKAAVFIETAKNVNVTQSKHGGFLRLAQLKLAKRLLVMPLHVFHQLGEKTGQTKTKMIFLIITGRCGSSLVAQVFEETGSAITYFEPDLSCVFAPGLKMTTSIKERIQTVRTCINIMCKPFEQRFISSYVFKFNSTVISNIPLILEVFPESIIMFLYRDGLKCSKSFAKISMELPLLKLIICLNGLSINITRKFTEWLGLPSEPYCIAGKSRILFGANIWCRAMRLFMDYRKSGMTIAALRYEDLVQDTDYGYQKMFKYCGLPYDAAAVKMAMGRDSQRGTPVSRKRLQRFNVEDFTEEIQMKTDSICDRYGLPHFLNTFITPGTITHRDKA